MSECGRAGVFWKEVWYVGLKKTQILRSAALSLLSDQSFYITSRSPPGGSNYIAWGGQLLVVAPLL